jgi:cytochrome c-type biogenesis protein CcmE
VDVSEEPSRDEQGGLDIDAPVRPRRAPRRGNKARVAVVLVLVVGAIAFLLYKGLGDSTTFFYNTDEAVERQDELGTDRFRMQGTVLDGSLEETADGVTFEVTYNGVEASVVHQGDPPELFQPNIPVVLEGHWDGGTFTSDRIIVKHSAEYTEDNGERLDEAEEGSTQP